MKVVIGGCIACSSRHHGLPATQPAMEPARRASDRRFRVSFRDRLSRSTGEIGSSSNPISGMTVATLLLTCLVFLFVGWTGPNYFVTALSIGGIVCIASSNGGTTSQDLKTGFLVGATPRYQQIAILIGALASALVLGPDSAEPERRLHGLCARDDLSESRERLARPRQGCRSPISPLSTTSRSPTRRRHYRSLC